MPWAHTQVATQEQTVQAKAAPSPEATAVAPLEPLHQFHVEDAGLDCTDCHTAPDTSEPGETLRLSVRPNHESCEACHDNIAEPEADEPICRTCHIDAQGGLATFPSGQTTLGHFSHAAHVDPQGRENAQSVRQDCVFCHTADADLRIPKRAGHPQCGACHNGDKAVNPVLEPEANSETCATCHTSSFCINCHLEPPRSHQPMQAFRAGAHRQIAALNLRSCFVCHQFEPTCAECHERGLRR